MCFCSVGSDFWTSGPAFGLAGAERNALCTKTAQIDSKCSQNALQVPRSGRQGASWATFLLPQAPFGPLGIAPACQPGGRWRLRLAAWSCPLWGTSTPLAPRASTAARSTRPSLAAGGCARGPWAPRGRPTGPWWPKAVFL